MAARKKTKSISRKKAVKKTTPLPIKLPSFDFLGKISFARRIPTKLSFDSIKGSRNFYFGLAVVGVALLAVLAVKYMVVAWVDNRPITRVELYRNLETRYGNDLREQMVIERLVMSEASRRNVNISNDEINAEIKKIEDQQGGAEQLNQILQLQGISQQEFDRLVKLQLIKQKMFTVNVTVSDEELDQYIEQNKATLQASLNTADENQSAEVSTEMKNNIREELKQQKVNKEFNTWLQEALQSDRVRRV